jgi:Putative auto-transporter adhesin, head GIN domain/Outer membrane protein beta-barrel domain
MKQLTIVIIATLLFSNIFAQNEVRSVEDFSILKVQSTIEAILTKGDKNEITITGTNADKVQSEIVDGKLTLYTKGKIKAKDGIVVHVTYKELKGIEQSGASGIKTTNTIITDVFYLKGSGAMEADLSIEVKELTLDFSGASEIKLKGSADDFSAKFSGASELNASNFIAKNVTLDISGASDVDVHATQAIRGVVSGASDVNVKGSPTVRELNKSGASSTGFGNNTSDNVSINVGTQKVEISDEDDVNVQLGNKQVKVNEDTTKVKWGVTTVYVTGDSVWVNRKVKKRRNHWAGVDLGINGFLNSSNSFDLSNDPNLALTDPKEVTQFMELNYRKSWTFSLNFYEKFIKIKTHHFGFVTGLGFEWSNYELKHNIKLNPKGGSFVFDEVTAFNEDYTWGEIDTVLDYSKNRFKTWFINVPLLLEINTGENKKNSFHVSAGAILGYNLQTKIKYKYEKDGDTKKVKDKQSFNTNPFRVSLTTRIGYGNWINLFATYSLTPLFEDGRGPELYPFTVGVTLLGF